MVIKKIYINQRQDGEMFGDSKQLSNWKKTTTEDYTLDIFQSLMPNYFPAIERNSTQIESGTIALNSYQIL